MHVGDGRADGLPRHNTLRGFLNVRDNLPALAAPPRGQRPGLVLTVCTVAMMICAVILAQAFAKWASVLGNGRGSSTRLKPRHLHPVSVMLVPVHSH